MCDACCQGQRVNTVKNIPVARGVTSPATPQLCQRERDGASEREEQRQRGMERDRAEIFTQFLFT